MTLSSTLPHFNQNFYKPPLQKPVNHITLKQTSLVFRNRDVRGEIYCFPMAGRISERKPAPSVAVILSTVMLMAVLENHRAVAQSNCNSALTSLTPCLNYVTGQDAEPTKDCCSALASVVKNNAPCLCQLLATNSSSINRNRALALPGECNVKTPPVSQCPGSGSSNTTPASSGSGTPITKTTPSSNPTNANGALGISVFSFVNLVAFVGFAGFLSW